MTRFEQPDLARQGAAAHLARLPVVAALAALAGYGASLLGIPLAWLLGALVTTALIGIVVQPVFVPPLLYKVGQVIVGVAVGLTMSAEVVSQLGVHALLAPLAAVLSIAVGRALCPVLWRFGSVDRATAYFSLVPAGIAEMAEQAGRHGADVGAVATFHAFRVGLMVLVLPLLVFVVVGPGDRVAPPSPETWRAAGWTPGFAAALAIGVVAALGARRIGVPSAFVLGPMAVLAVLSAAGLIDAKEPRSILAVAQVMLGLGIGARFTRATVERLPRALAVGVPLMIFHAGLLVGLGVLVAFGLGLDPVVLALGASTGGVAEMVLTAKAVGANAALVTFYQVVRGLSGNLSAGMVFERTVAPAMPPDRGGRDD